MKLAQKHIVTNFEHKVGHQCIPMIDDSDKSWTSLAETLKDAANEHNDDCLNHVDLTELQKITLNIVSKEENLFKNLSKIKI